MHVGAQIPRGQSSLQATHPEVGTEDMWVGAGHLQNALDNLTQQLWRVQVLQDGLQTAHHKLKQAPR